MIYADTAATTKLHPDAYKAMMPYLDARYFNPSGVYQNGVDIRRAINKAHASIGRALSCKANEIFITSGGTEADNWAIKQFMCDGPGHIITSSIEHKAVLNSCATLQKMGWEITYLPVDKNGFVSPADLDAAIRSDTKLVSIMLANNEVGTIEPIKELCTVTHSHGVPFHTDAVQAVGHIPINVNELGVDFLSLSAHKFGGPKGTGALYVRQGKIATFIDGGGQEMGRRSGTENVPGIIGTAAAIEIATSHLLCDMAKLSAKRDRLINGIISLDGVMLSGAPAGEHRLPGHASFIIHGVDSETLVMDLALKGICVSAGSACSSGTGKPSYVLRAMGYTEKEAWCSLRITIDLSTTLAEVDEIVTAVTGSINKNRKEVHT